MGELFDSATNHEILDEDITSVGALIINSEGKILAFARRGNETRLGLVAGEREEGESLKEAIEREVREETGIEAETSDKPFFIAKPHDGGYCATFLIKSDAIGPLPLANSDGQNNSEGYAFWMEPEEFINTGKSAYLEYNTALLNNAKAQNILDF